MIYVCIGKLELAGQRYAKTPAAEHPGSQFALNDDKIYLFSKYHECYRKQLPISTNTQMLCRRMT